MFSFEITRSIFRNRIWLWLATPALIFTINAFPPAPHHTIYGLVRNELGNPLSGDNAKIILETADGVQIRGNIIPDLDPGMNYRLLIPMDSGLNLVPYAPYALHPTTSFLLRVEIAGNTYLPIEMSGDFASLGDPAKKTLINLTLGIDSDGDGLPDAWERHLMGLLGGDLTLESINKESDLDGDGLNNYEEYIAGTYANDPEDGFALAIAGFGDEGPLLEFLAIRNRTYSIFGSTDLQNWVPLHFRMMSEGSEAPARVRYQALEARVLRVEALPSPESGIQFFKLLVQ